MAKLSPETIARIAAKNTGKVRTPEMRERMSKAQIGKHKSPEIRARMSAGLKGNKQIGRKRAVMIVENGRRFDSLSELARELRITVSTITNALKRSGKVQGFTIVEIKETPEA